MSVEHDPVRSALTLLRDAQPSPHLAPRIKASVGASRQRPSGTFRLAIAMVAAVAIALGGLWLGLRPTQGPAAVSPPPAASASRTPPSAAPSLPTPKSSAPTAEPPAAVLPGSWRPTRLPSIDGRSSHAMVWTGTEAVIWGGTASSSDPNHSVFEGLMPRNGAAYDPAGDRWRTIPNAPIAGRINPLMAWTGREVVVFGGQIGTQSPLDGAAWNPASNRWRTIARSPLTGSEAVGAWLDGRLYVVTSAGAAAYDAGADDWALMPAAPIRPGWRTAVVAAGRVFVVAYGDGATPPVEWAVLDPATGAWRHGLVPLEPLTAGVGFAGAGDRVVVTDTGDTFDPVAGMWGKTTICEGVSAGTIWTGRYLLGVTGAWDSRGAGSCLQLPPAPKREPPFDDTNGREFPAAVWSGRQFITWSGGTGGDIVWVPKDGAIFTPVDDLGPGAP